MKMYNIVLILILATIIVPDVFLYLKLKSMKVRPVFVALHLISPIFFSASFFVVKFGLDDINNYRLLWGVMWLFYFFLVIYTPKLLLIISYGLNYLHRRKYKRDYRFLNTLRIIVSVLFVVIMLVSTFITPRNYEVTHTDIYIKDLPDGFKDYKIVQISDIHLGSWYKDTTKLSKVIDLVNKENPDLVVFTGDMVNNFAGETERWTSIFRRLNAQSTKFAVLGNHDYGDYTLWNSKELKKKNFDEIKEAIRSFGFELLLNENSYLRKNKDSLMIVGVENWGKNETTRYSDLNLSLKGSNSDELKILLSHDPNHWEAEVWGRKDIVLTLAGHTHAGQGGIKISGKLYSPVSFIYKHWSGLYEKNGQKLYVNRGIGYIGLPLFVGVRPEITTLTLKAELTP